LQDKLIFGILKSDECSHKLLRGYHEFELAPLFLVRKLGIVISVVLPSTWTAVRGYWQLQKAAPAGLSDAAGQVWILIKPYLLLGLASSLTGILLMAALSEQITSASGAVLAGYAWDSTLQKLAKA
jgi:hypothetical protein